MAQPRDYEYRIQGSAAVEPAFYPQRRTESPAPRRKPQSAPRHKRHPQPKTHARMAVAPFAVVGVGVALLMLVLVLVGYAKVYESAEALGQVERQVENLQEENQKLRNQYDSSIDLEDIELRARELGMQQPSAKQTIALQVPAEDTAVVARKDASNPFRAAWNAIVETAQELWAYLR